MQDVTLVFLALYLRVPRLAEMLRIAHADGSFGRSLSQLARIDVLILDDWGLTPLDQTAREQFEQPRLRGGMTSAN